MTDKSTVQDRQHGHAVTAAASFIVGGGETGALIREIDWSTTPLGPATSWPACLRTSLNLCVGSMFPIALYWGRDFVMLYNDALLPMVGANKHPAAMGRPAFEVLPEIREVIEPLLVQVLDTGEAIWSEDLMLPLLRYQTQEESYFTFNYSPIRDEAGVVVGVFCAVIETTEKVIESRRLRLLHALASAMQGRTAAEACALAAAQLATARDDIPFALLYLFDDAGQIATLAGRANLAPGDPHAPATIALDAPSLWALPGGATIQHLELADGPAGARGAAILPIERSGGGRPLGFLVAGVSAVLRRTPSYDRFHNLLAGSISQGVSHAIAYEAERARAESLAELDRAKTTFFSNVSHELRTPLTLMLAPIQDLVALPDGAPVDRGSAELLQRSALRLLKLVNTLLEFSRIEAGRVEASYEPTELAALTADLASNFRAAIERAGLALVVDCPPLPEPVYVDPEMWEKIVLNLLSNAFKFTFEGSITVRLRAEPGHVVLAIADTGTGISSDELPRLFERFHRIEGARSRSQEGSGIGLALIQELIRLHGGDVGVTSAPGAGTTFEVRIPRGAAHLPAERVHAPRALASTAVSVDSYVGEAARWDDRTPALAGPARSTGERPRIVVADDNADMREYVGRLLGERWDVELVGDGARALAAIRANPPALVLSDVMMPELDGFGLIQAMRGDPQLRAIPVIFLSARAGEDDTARGLGAGANGYLAKPFSARELLVRVTAALTTARVNDEMRAREMIQRGNLYRHFMQAPFLVCVFQGPDHVIELANPPILQGWGKTAAILGLPLRDAIPELRDQPFSSYLDGVFRTGVAYEGRAELARLPTGPGGALEDNYYNFVYAPLRDPAGEVEGVLVSAFNVTEQVVARLERARHLEDERVARATAEAAGARIHELFMLAPTPICIMEGPEHRFTLANEPYLRMVDRQNLIGKTFIEAFPERIALTLERLARVYRTGETEQVPDVAFRFARRQPGVTEDALLNVIYEPFRDLNGDVAGIMCLAFDVTDERLARRASEQARRDAEAASAAQRAVVEFQERFVAVLGHDLRNPLAAIDMAAGLLNQMAERAGNTAALRVLGRVRSSSLRMSRMVAQILDLSRSRIGGGLAIAPIETDLCAVLTGVVEELRTAHPARVIALSCPPCPGRWDRDRLEQVFSNLIGNAVLHGSPDTGVTVDATADAAAVHVVVHNDGPAIPESARATLFQPFRRGERDSRGPKTAGLGLGLYISRELVVAHGGEIAVQSSAEHGTTFHVTLPINTPDPEVPNP